jgi:hypothetical protein
MIKRCDDCQGVVPLCLRLVVNDYELTERLVLKRPR